MTSQLSRRVWWEILESLLILMLTTLLVQFFRETSFIDRMRSYHYDFIEVWLGFLAQVQVDSRILPWMGKMERELQWWKGQLAADIHQSLRIKVSLLG